MSKLYFETNALIKLRNYGCNGNAYTSVFALFELISGITNQCEFDKRKACIIKVIDPKLHIKPKMVDQIFCELVRAKPIYRKNFYDNIKAMSSTYHYNEQKKT